MKLAMVKLETAGPRRLFRLSRSVSPQRRAAPPHPGAAAGDSLYSPRMPLGPRRLALVSAAFWAAVKLGLHLAFLAPYGWFRDELYYVACSRHLAFGYVDHPPLSIAILRLWRSVAGDSLVAMRVVPALAGAATVYLAGAIAVELGGGLVAVTLTSLSLLTAPILLFTSHAYSMNALDVLAWTASGLLVLRALRTNRVGDWVALGLVLGLGLENKISVLWLGAALLVALVATPHRRVLASKGPYLAAVVAVLVFVPHLVWQAQHGFPTLEFMRNAMEHKYVRQSPLAFLAEVALGMNVATVLVWIPGLAFGLARPGPARFPAIVFASVLALLLAARTKSEYLAAAFPMILAVGGCFWDQVLRGVRARLVIAAVLAVLVVVPGAASVPFALPVLPVDDYVAYQAALGQRPHSSEKKDLSDLPQHYADMIGWPELAALVDQAAATLGTDERRGAVIWVWGDYGVAGAIEELGHTGLHVACGHNNYWWWGPGSGDGRAVIVVGGKRERVAQYFREVVPVGSFECARCMPYENHKPIYVGRGLLRPLADLWPDERFYE